MWKTQEQSYDQIWFVLYLAILLAASHYDAEKERQQYLPFEDKAAKKVLYQLKKSSQGQVQETCGSKLFLSECESQKKIAKKEEGQ